MCNNDNDIETFLKERAITFEKLGKSRTFLIFDEDEEDFKILAYFTLALQVLKIPDNLYNRTIENLDGFNAKIRGEVITELPTILIGQIGKNDTYKDEISGDDLMQYCLNIILEGQSRVGGRIIMLECKDIKVLTDLYEKFGFTKVDKDYEEDELIQYIRILQEDELIEVGQVE